MRILILTFYYTPDLCAGSFRAAALVKALVNQVPPNSQIDIVTTLPNRYSTFKSAASENENTTGLSVHRIALPAHKSGILDQSRAFIAFYYLAIKYVEDRDYDLVLGTSSRLMTAVMAARISSKKKTPLYLDIRDIFLDTLSDVLPKYATVLFKPIIGLLEKYTFSKADQINLVSRGFEGYFKKRYPTKKLSFFTNGIDVEFLNAVNNVEKPNSKRPGVTTVVYAGNLGEGQGLHIILPMLAKKLGAAVKFRIIGDGGRKDELFRAIEDLQVKNVTMLPPMKRDALIEEYLEADVLFLHLNKFDAFKKVLPSKIFEYAAMGKPIWAGVSGYPADFIAAEIENAARFQPGDVDDAVAAFERIELGFTSRAGFIIKFSRHNIMRDMAVDVCRVAEGRGK